MIDWARVDALRQDVGEADLAEVVTLFLSETEETLERLARPGAARAPDMLHAVKGSALGLGLRDLARLCAQGEADLTRGERGPDPAALRTCFVQSRRLLLAGLADRAIR
jgi:HPt (histidine-containing phosphotransfer) domain-containing protein